MTPLYLCFIAYALLVGIGLIFHTYTQEHMLIERQIGSTIKLFQIAGKINRNPVLSISRVFYLNHTKHPVINPFVSCVMIGPTLCELLNLIHLVRVSYAHYCISYRPFQSLLTLFYDCVREESFTYG